jgi:hypothetical protein
VLGVVAVMQSRQLRPFHLIQAVPIDRICLNFLIGEVVKVRGRVGNRPIFPVATELWRNEIVKKRPLHQKSLFSSYWGGEMDAIVVYRKFVFLIVFHWLTSPDRQIEPANLCRPGPPSLVHLPADLFEHITINGIKNHRKKLSQRVLIAAAHFGVSVAPNRFKLFSAVAFSQQSADVVPKARAALLGHMA